MLACEQQLASLRKQIDEIDSELTESLTKRSQLIAEVAQLKCHYKLPLYDAKRESFILQTILNKNSTKYRTEDLAAIFYSIFRAGLNQQLLYRADYKE